MKFTFNWGAVKSALLKLLKTQLIKKALMTLLGTSTGALAWVVSFILELGWDQIAVPLFNYAEKKGMFIYDFVDGKIKVLKMKEAKANNDENAYNSLVDGA